MGNTKKRFLMPSAIALAVICTSYPALAAVVPEGVKLAKKQQIVRNNGAEVQSLDPHKVQGVPESNILRDISEGLLISDAEGKVIPAVAESWTHDDTFKVWTFKLANNVKWSNGEPVTAQDFVYSWQRLSNPNTASPYSSYLQYAHILNSEAIIKGEKSPSELGVKALDNNTLQVILSESVPYFPKMLVHQSMSPVHKATVEKYGDKWTRPENWVGNGAYKLKEWVINERLVLERSPTYRDNANTVIEQVTFLPIASEVNDVNRYRSGEIDITNYSLPLELYAKLKKELPNELRQSPLLCTYYYELNNQKPPLNDPRVRTALKLTLDRDTIANKIKNQGEIEAYNFTPPYIDGFHIQNPEWAKWSQKQREEEARKLLEQAGFSKQKPLTLTLLYNTSGVHQKIAIAAASMWKKALGANIKLENQEWKSFLDTRQTGKQEIARAGWCADYNEASTFLNVMKSNSSNNMSQYKSVEFDELMKKSLTAQTDEERTQIYQQAEALLDKDSALIPVYFHVNSRLVKPYVGGYSTKDPLNHTYTKDLYIMEK